MAGLLDVAGIAVSPDHYIGGERVASRETFPLFSPIDQRPLGDIARAGSQDVDAAISAAQRAFPAWAALTAAERQPVLNRFADEIGRRAEAFCLLESNDAGVLLSRMRHGVVPRAVQNIRWFAEAALRLATLAPACVSVLATGFGLVMRRVVEPETVRQVCLYRPLARPLSPAAEAFADHLARWLPQWAAAAPGAAT